MPLVLDHVSLRTADAARLAAWYGRVLGLTPGPRPDFSFPGIWLYSGEQAVIHLIEVSPAPSPDPGDLTLQHFSLRGDDLAGFLDGLRREGVRWRASHMPPGPADVVLINVSDPDGNAFHVDFPRGQADGIDLAG